MHLKGTNQRGRVRARCRAATGPDPELAAELTAEQAQLAQDRLLERIGESAALCRQLEARLRRDPAPELETIIKLYRVLVLTLSTELRAAPQLRHLVLALMRPVMEWARLEQKHKSCEAARRAAQPDEPGDRARALRPATLEKIEHDLTLF